MTAGWIPLHAAIRPELFVGIDPAAPNGDHMGVALISRSHPEGPFVVHDSYTLDPKSLERIEITIDLHLTPGNCPELAYAYSAPECNDEHGPTAVAKLARERAEARIARKYARRARYMRQHR